MLVEKKDGLNGKAIAIKLLTGEEIIAHCVEDLNGELRIVNPLAMVMMPGEEQEGMVMFAPWMLALDDDTVITIPHDKYVVYVAARRDASQQYYGAVGQPGAVEEPKVAPQILTGGRKGGRGR